MSFPNVIYGDYGDEKRSQSTKIGNLPLGQLMILPDGRQFRHAQAGTTSAIATGMLCSVSAGAAGHGNVAASGLIASATTTRNLSTHTDVYVAASKVAFTLDQFADGYLNIQDDTGEGHIYRVKANALAASVAAGGDLHIELYPSDPLLHTLKAGTTTVSLRKNPFKDQIIAASIKTLTGVTPVAVSASHYFWLQRSGVASVMTSTTTVTDGAPVTGSTDEAGSVCVMIAASLATQHIIGQALETVTATEWAMIDLNLE